MTEDISNNYRLTEFPINVFDFYTKYDGSVGTALAGNLRKPAALETARETVKEYDIGTLVANGGTALRKLTPYLNKLEINVFRSTLSQSLKALLGCSIAAKHATEYYDRCSAERALPSYMLMLKGIVDDITKLAEIPDKEKVSEIAALLIECYTPKLFSPLKII